jgi:hypothetical protein
MSPRARLAWSWTLVILLLCWLPRAYIPENERVPGPFFIPHLDKLVHMGIFVVWAFFWMRVAQPPHQGRRVFLAGVALAILSELGQMVPIVHRDAGFEDGLADILGVAVGMLAFYSARKFLVQ